MNNTTNTNTTNTCPHYRHLLPHECGLCQAAAKRAARRAGFNVQCRYCHTVMDYDRVQHHTVNAGRDCEDGYTTCPVCGEMDSTTMDIDRTKTYANSPKVRDDAEHAARLAARKANEWTVSTVHGVECKACNEATASAVGIAKATGSVGATYSDNGNHVATVKRAVAK